MKTVSPVISSSEIAEEAQEQVSSHQFEPPAITTASRRTGMTWAQRVGAAALSISVRPKPEDLMADRVSHQDRPHTTLDRRKSLAKLDSRKEFPNTIYLAPTSFDLTMPSQTADDPDQTTRVADFIGAATPDSSDVIPDTLVPTSQGPPAPSELIRPDEHRWRAKVVVPPAQSTQSTSSGVPWLESTGDTRKQKPEDQPQSTIQKTHNDGNRTEGRDQNGWQTVVRRSKATQRLLPTKSKKAAKRAARLLKDTFRGSAFVASPPERPPSPAPLTSQAWPILQTNSASTLLSLSKPVLEKPSYAAVATLRPPVMSMSSPSSSADASFVSAPQSPQHHITATPSRRLSPGSPNDYFSATEDLETSSDSFEKRNTVVANSTPDTGYVPLLLSKATDENPLTPNNGLTNTPIVDLYNGQDAPAEQDPVGYRSSCSRARDGSPHRNGRRATERSLSSIGPVPNSASAFPGYHTNFKRNAIAPDGNKFDLHAGKFPTAGNTEVFHAHDQKSQVQVEPGKSAGLLPKSDHTPLNSQAFKDHKLAATDLHLERRKSTQSADNNLGDASGAPPCPTKSTSRRGDLSINEHASSSVKDSCSEQASEGLSRNNPQAENQGEYANPIKKPTVRSETRVPTKLPVVENDRTDLKDFNSNDHSKTSTLTSPATKLTSPHRQPPTSDLNTPQRSPKKRGRPVNEVSEESPIESTEPRERSTLRGEAPEFTPQKAPSKPQSSPLRLGSPIRPRPRLPDEWAYSHIAQRTNPTYGGSVPLTAPSSLVGGKPGTPILKPWMSKDYWIYRKEGYEEHETGSHGVGDDTRLVWNTSAHLGQLRRLKPCSTITIQQAGEQIGTWCYRCDPDH